MQQYGFIEKEKKWKSYALNDGTPYAGKLARTV